MPVSSEKCYDCSIHANPFSNSKGLRSLPVFLLSLKHLLPGSITPKSMLICYIMLRLTENSIVWNFERWTCEISELESQWSGCIATSGKRRGEIRREEMFLFQVCFNHLNLANTSCPHLSGKKKKQKTAGCWRWSTQTLEICRHQRWRWTDLTWWCLWCWGCSGTGPRTVARRTRTCWRSRRAAGLFWWAWLLAWHSRWTWGGRSQLLASRSHSVYWQKE